MYSSKRRDAGLASVALVLATVAVAVPVVALLSFAAVVAQERHDRGTGTRHPESAVVPSKQLEARQAAIDAYIYAYPLVTMEMTRRFMTNVAQPTPTAAPMGRFVRMRTYPPVDYHGVTAPNADTLYTSAWLDVSKEPWIISIPDMKGRYYLFPMLDGWTNVFEDPGTRTTGTGPQKYAITGPGWSGTLPNGVKQYTSPTSLVWILGRIYCTGTPEDYKAVHALQDQVSLVPLSSYGKPYRPAPAVVDPGIDTKTAVRDQVNAMDAKTYFSLFAHLLKTNPPAADDGPMMTTLAAIGIVPGEDFDELKLDPVVAQAVTSAVKPAQHAIVTWMKKGVAAGDSNFEDGWMFSTKTGRYGTSYRQRAMITWFGLGANRPEDAVYPTSEGPDAATKYSGEHRYVMHFTQGEMPPVNGFWSLTMYDASYFFVPNALNRYTLSRRNTLVTNADGSVDLFIQHDSPGKDKEANWLPAPQGQFVLMLRMYWPKEKSPSILDGTWTIPPVKQID